VCVIEFIYTRHRLPVQASYFIFERTAQDTDTARSPNFRKEWNKPVNQKNQDRAQDKIKEDSLACLPIQMFKHSYTGLRFKVSSKTLLSNFIWSARESNQQFAEFSD
jgi:hypothetical protein